MGSLVRISGVVVFAAFRFLRLAPKLVPLAMVSVISLSAAQPARPDPDGDGDETAQSIVYRHYI